MSVSTSTVRTPCCQSPHTDIKDPATGKSLGSVADMTVEDTQQAVKNAYTAFKSFAKTTPQSRADTLSALHAAILANKEDLARLITLENGKAYRDAMAEVMYSASYVQWNAGEALRMYGRTIPSSLPGTRNMTQLQVRLMASPGQELTFVRSLSVSLPPSARGTLPLACRSVSLPQLSL